MNSQPLIVVEPPDSRGLRDVRVRGEVVGRAWSLQDLRNLLRRAGVPKDLDLKDSELIHWRGGGFEAWPDRPWRRRAISVLMAAGLLITAGVLGRIGKTDISEALTYGGRVAGATFLFAGAVEVIAAIAVFDYLGKRRWVYSGAAVLIGVVIALAVNTLLLFMQIDAGEYTHYAWIWPTVLLWSFWALWKVNPRQVWRQSPHPRKVAIGAAVTALIAIANLIYSQVYIPYSNPITMRMVVNFGKPQLNAERTVLYLPMTVSVKNSGKVPFYILGSLYEVYGRSADFTEKARGMKDWKGDLQAGGDVERNIKVLGRELISFGAIMVDESGSFLEAGDEFREDKIVSISATSEFDSIDGSAQAVVLRKDRGTLSSDYVDSATASWYDDLSHAEDAPKWVAQAGDEYIKFHARLRYSTEILNVTRRPRYVTLWRVAHKSPDVKFDEYGNIIATISLKGEEGREPSALEWEETSESYGLFWMYSGTVRESFAALVKPPTGQR
ncbi:hypothetical protein J7E87_19400 [Streptomyces sp. ISL-1]|uniref:hypothetical protein n=1 Tax=Streptomyces sp. ISL-1 TaxID=2817657 RepID=UPI001BEC1808|nr:hypothetical protein [Streptomyces sp. ISL-1]MBT2391540.1 hypothetical protein [Streptomyces sp. ISL-1]